MVGGGVDISRFDDGARLTLIRLALFDADLTFLTTITRYEIAYRYVDRKVGAPSSGVGQVAGPFRRAVFGAVYLQKRDGTRRFELVVHPYQRQTGQGGESFERGLLGISQEVTHLAAIRHAGEVGAVFAQPVLLLNVGRQPAHGFNIIDFPPCLKGVSCVPTAISLGVGQTYGYTHGKSVSLRCLIHPRVDVAAAAITMEREYQRSIFLQSVGKVHIIMAQITAHLHRVVNNALGADGGLKETPQSDQDRETEDELRQTLATASEDGR